MLLKDQFYDIGYQEDPFNCDIFTNTRKIVHDYTTEYKKSAILLNLKVEVPQTLIKNWELHGYIRKEFTPFEVKNLNDAGKKALFIEYKNRKPAVSGEMENQGVPNIKNLLSKRTEIGLSPLLSDSKDNTRNHCNHCSVDLLAHWEIMLEITPKITSYNLEETSMRMLRDKTGKFPEENIAYMSAETTN